jgi:hypothetical protein
VWRYSFVPEILSFSTYASLRIPFVFDQRACGIPLFLTYVPPMSLPFRQRSASEPACLPVNEPAFRQRFVCKEPVYLSACLPACLPVNEPAFLQRFACELSMRLPTFCQRACQRVSNETADLSTSLLACLPAHEPITFEICLVFEN